MIAQGECSGLSSGAPDASRVGADGDGHRAVVVRAVVGADHAVAVGAVATDRRSIVIVAVTAVGVVAGAVLTVSAVAQIGHRVVDHVELRAVDRSCQLVVSAISQLDNRAVVRARRLTET